MTFNSQRGIPLTEKDSISPRENSQHNAVGHRRLRYPLRKTGLLI